MPSTGHTGSDIEREDVASRWRSNYRELSLDFEALESEHRKLRTEYLSLAQRHHALIQRYNYLQRTGR